MGAVIGDILPLAVGVAISPIPIIAAILMLLGEYARTTGSAFAVGWLSGVLLAAVVFVLIGGSLDATGQEGAAVAWIKLVLGVLLLLLGVHDWRSHSDDSAPPKWMAAIDEMRAPTGFGIGFALAAVNPKNLMLAAAAGVTIGSAGLAAGQSMVAVAVFVVIASLTVAGPVIAYLVAADRLAPRLAALQKWLQANNQAVMAVLFLVLGVSLIGKGIGGLS